jgi:LuxR family transcriptional regulator, maltose regulon positive regulatory protein
MVVQAQSSRVPLLEAVRVRPSPLTEPSGLVDRGQLEAKLEQSVRNQITIVSAPAGSGKTTLLTAWAQRSTADVAFVSIDRDQHDAHQFWLAVLDALDRASRPGAHGLPATPDFDPATVVERILSDLAERTEPLVLIVDDLHELRSAEALEQLERLVVGLPPSASAVLSSRHEPSFHLHRLRLTGEVTAIRARDLRFTETEAQKLLRASGIDLPDSGATALWQRTEGWAAGLRLAAISLAGEPDPKRFVEEFSGGDRAVGEYLLAEMLERQPSEVQGMLLRTSIVARLNGELADALAERSDSERVLLDLEDANAFVASIDRDRTWFRYHQLLADFLRLELRRRHADEVPELHRRAARWFAEQGEMIEAVRHTLAAGDWPDAATLLADNLFSLTLDGQQGAIAALLRSFPRGASADHPELALAHAATQLAEGRLEEASVHLALAESSLESAPPERRRRVEIAIASSRLALARRSGRFAEAIEQIDLLGPGGGESVESLLDSDLRGVALMNLGIAEMWSGRLEQAERHLSRGAALAQKIDRPYLEVACRAHLGFATKAHSFAAARERSLQAVALAEGHGWDDRPLIAPALATLAGVSVWMGEFDDGQRWLDRAWAAVAENLDVATGVLLHIVTGMLAAARGEHERSLEEFERAESSQAQLEGEHLLAPQASAWLAATQARLGRPQEARALLEGLPEERARTGEVRGAWAAVKLAEDQPEAALEDAQAVLDGTAPVLHHFTTVEVQLLAGLAHLALGQRREAKLATEAALAEAEPDKLVLPFVMTRSLPLLDVLPPHETAHRALMIEVRELLEGTRESADHRQDLAAPAEPLSPTELRVLRYLPTNLTRPEIARELFVSINTVNTHVRNIYAKLGTSRRSSTVQRARDLKLLAVDRSR